MNEKLNYIRQLDLSYICLQMSADSYVLPHWSYEQAKQCETLYKRFLILLVLYPQYQLVPTRDIDEFWHNHILHTKNYCQDCNEIFGHYLHHQPSNGNDIEQLAHNFVLTKQVYLKEFHQELMVFHTKSQQ